jgi:hypothetical protein
MVSTECVLFSFTTSWSWKTVTGIIINREQSDFRFPLVIYEMQSRYQEKMVQAPGKSSPWHISQPTTALKEGKLGRKESPWRGCEINMNCNYTWPTKPVLPHAPRSIYPMPVPVLLSRAMFTIASWYASSTSSWVTTSLILFHFSG